MNFAASSGDDLSASEDDCKGARDENEGNTCADSHFGANDNYNDDIMVIMKYIVFQRLFLVLSLTLYLSISSPHPSILIYVNLDIFRR